MSGMKFLLQVKVADRTEHMYVALLQQKKKQGEWWACIRQQHLA